ncbi:MAG: hypothetical protein RLZZ403_1132 [Pseudomonadota bacterium]
MTPDELKRLLEDPVLRLETLYWIITKGDSDDDLVVQFVPNVVQWNLMDQLWHRNLVLKARQRGITTLIAILWLDTALFSPGPVYCGIIAHEREAAEEIFRTKVVFAYQRLPEELQAKFPLEKKTATELVFAHNGATIRVATSMRSGTIHRLHVSELGKIAAKYPFKAREVLTGSIPAVPTSGILVVESTAEGQDGAFYDLAQIAKETSDSGRPLSQKDYRFHFFSWWDADEYEIDPSLVVFTDRDHEYFRRVEAIIGRPISMRKRAWYVATRRADFADEAPLMWQEYPSYPDEAFAVSMEGCYYATQITTARLQGRILPSLPIVSAPVNSFWDIGKGDMTSLWLHQRVGPENRFIRYYEASGEDLDHYASYLQRTGFVFGTHYLPHEADHKRMGKDADHNQSIREMLEELLPGQRFEVVPRVTQLMAGIQATRRQFASCWFDESGCQQGIKRLTAYRKHWDKVRGCWSDNHEHNDDSHGADAFRQFGQVADSGETFSVATSPNNSGLRRRSANWRL